MIPKDCRRKTWIFKQVNIFSTPPTWLSPKMPGLDPPLTSPLYFPKKSYMTKLKKIFKANIFAIQRSEPCLMPIKVIRQKPFVKRNMFMSLGTARTSSGSRNWHPGFRVICIDAALILNYCCRFDCPSADVWLQQGSLFRGFDRFVMLMMNNRVWIA